MSKKSDKIIGIDLGSYNSSVSVYEGNEVKVFKKDGDSVIMSREAVTENLDRIMSARM